MVKLFGKPVRVSKSAADRRTLDVRVPLRVNAHYHNSTPLSLSRPIRIPD